ncbi:MAG TPA: DUF1697 domain-containing protein [Ilumatobacteraceae bacterium]|nr:DUF1697 domain-containing protein [Ilumatobacteraceae bacterium]
MTTTRYVALLRGVNVAGRGTVKMDDLRHVFDALGYDDVATYIQSGNVIFTSDGPVDAGTVERAIEADLGMNVTVVLRTSAQLKGVVRRNPFTDVDTSKLHIGFMAERPPAAAVRSLDRERFSPDDVVVDGGELYFHLPNGIGRSKLPVYVGRQLKVPTTVRNWNTVTKLVDLVTA